MFRQLFLIDCQFSKFICIENVRLCNDFLAKGCPTGALSKGKIDTPSRLRRSGSRYRNRD